MAGFKNMREWVDADLAGQYHITQFRKAASASATTTSAWTDYSYYSGSPVANFYASTPLEAAEVDQERGIYVPTVSPAKQYLRNLKLMTAASAAASTANGRQQIILADILMYYPFVDTDAVGEDQLLTNGITLPRYSSGQVIAVGQSAASTAGLFTFSYTNQDGTAGRTSQAHNTFAVAAGGQVVASSVGAAASYHPYCSLAAGDTGVSDIVSLVWSGTAHASGTVIIGLCKPLFTIPVPATGLYTKVDFLNAFPSLPRIRDGANIQFLVFNTGATSSAGSVMIDFDYAYGG